jgi:hypothetical protein
MSTPNDSTKLHNRFWSKVNANSPAECWPWTGGVTHNGYGKFSLGPLCARRIVRSHRLVWEMVHGAVPDGMQVLHRCDNPRCCNPEHLFLGTNADNVADKVAKNRQARIGKYRDARGRWTPRRVPATELIR